MKYNLVLICAILLAIGCTSPQDEKKSQDSLAGEWAVVDSVTVEYLGNMTLSDISPDGKHLLAADYRKNTYFILNESGEILQELQKGGDTPDTYGQYLSEMGFWDDQTVFIMGTKAIKWYDLQGNEVKSTPMKGDYQKSVTMRYTGGQAQKISLGDEQHLLHQGHMPKIKRTEKRYMDEVRGGTLINTNNFEMIELFPLEEDSRFRDGNLYDNGDLYSRLAVGEDKIYVSFDGDPTLYAYEKDEPFNLAFKKPLTLQNVQPNEGMPVEYADVDVYFDPAKSGLRFLQADNRSVYLQYFEGISKERMAELEQIDDMNKWMAEYEEELNTRENRLKLFDAEGNEQVDLRLHDKFDGQAGFLARHDHLYFNKVKNEEEEEDYVVFYKVRVE
ncbi:hypothetical protein KI659_17170 [Litoribacter alkaliphilus]|uniref:Lipoprotein n=1 Tax=Litoribacter ruber TaxID=702568 RepID=A0AAP2G283_9BACT|nr:hypothetical protein [Litoribacter alkaliphilus]MBS9525754.1 hypothetical protein [Litoribacter alkaliphilus]